MLYAIPSIIHTHLPLHLHFSLSPSLPPLSSSHLHQDGGIQRRCQVPAPSSCSIAPAPPSDVLSASPGTRLPKRSRTEGSSAGEGRADEIHHRRHLPFTGGRGIQRPPYARASSPRPPHPLAADPSDRRSWTGVGDGADPKEADVVGGGRRRRDTVEGGRPHARHGQGIPRVAGQVSVACPSLIWGSSSPSQIHLYVSLSSGAARMEATNNWFSCLKLDPCFSCEMK